MDKPNYKRYDLPPVNAGGERVSLNLELDNDISELLGLQLVSDREDHLYHRGSLGMQVSGWEIFAGDFHARLLMCGLGVEPGRRHYPLSVSRGNGMVKISYTDSATPVLPFAGAYTVSVYLKVRPCNG